MMNTECACTRLDLVVWSGPDLIVTSRGGAGRVTRMTPTDGCTSLKTNTSSERLLFRMALVDIRRFYKVWNHRNELLRALLGNQW